MYKLTRQEVKAKRVSRKGGKFNRDPALQTNVATLEDYRHSGYDRGHMAPAADLAWSEQAMKESFYLSNICPQNHEFNSGIWAELEQKLRYWATLEGELYIVTGPILPKTTTITIGPNKVTVPEAFYKVVYAPRQQKAIGFILRNMPSKQPLQTFTVSVDYVETVTGLDFFSELEDKIETDVEQQRNPSDWRW